MQQNSVLRPSKQCGWCSNIGAQRCGRCQSVYYCSREHQVEHWSEHRKVCRSPGSDSASSNQSRPSSSSNSAIGKPPQSPQQLAAINQWRQNASSISAAGPTNYQADTGHNLFSSLGSEDLSSDNNFWNLINNYSAQNLINENSSEIETLTTSHVEPQPPSTLNSSSDDSLMYGKPLKTICRTVVHDLNNYGICVLDKFLGNKMGAAIFNDVQKLYSQGIFKRGELVTKNPFLAKETIRSDVTTWLDGTEVEYPNISTLIRKLDLVVTTCNKLPENGKLSNYKLHRRTKAMVACYPGNGAHYKKHVDNPYKDGRCITCIYYLNQNWDVESQGGLLRMFPTSHATQMVDIEPIFDRMIFFWSDKRNPHEVQPAHATRFAITVWYFDADERAQALSNYRSQQTARNLAN